MIGRLRGVLLEKQAPHLLVDVQGVGYELDAPMSTFYTLPEVGDAVILHTHLVVREDSHTLYGFATREERSLFRSLLKVNGVGARLALTILSGMSVTDFIRCVEIEDVGTLTRMPGVGKKTAERLVVEMKDRLAHWQDEAGRPVAPPTAVAAARPGPGHALGEAVSALIALGYKPPEASRMVRAIEHVHDLSSEEIIRQALQAAVK